jgi:hypothetical protein
MYGHRGLKGGVHPLKFYTLSFPKAEIIPEPRGCVSFVGIYLHLQDVGNRVTLKPYLSPKMKYITLFGG